MRRCKPYSYKDERVLTPAEMFKLHGWSSPKLESQCKSALLDLIGDSMAMPLLAVSLMSLLVAVGEEMPFLWDA